MRRRFWFSIIGVIAVAAIVIGINMFADARLAYVHADLTQNHIYTLSPGTRQHPAKPEGTDHAAAVLLAPARQHRAGLWRLRRPCARDAGAIRRRLGRQDPAAISTTPSRSATPRTRPWPYGLQGVPVDQAGTQVYFGLAGSNLLDDERTIAFFQPERERFLEYDLTKLVYELSNPKRPVVGVMSSLPLDGNPQLDDDDARAAGRAALRLHRAAAADQHGEDRRRPTRR